MLIAYRMTKDEWRKSSDLRHCEVAPTYYGFAGRVTIRGAGRSLFGRSALQLSVADLACALAENIEAGFPGAGRTYGRFEEGEGAIAVAMAFDEDTGLVTLRTEGLGRTVVVQRDEFVLGAKSSLRRFVGDLSRHVEDPFGWADLKILAPYATSPSGPSDERPDF
jgi:hypothetical protein